uniref:Uncharacterized protein n=1 Tax=viral metagenome TaxID=1070528 RepID=A0A6C0K1J1_9ZZZZ
MIILYCIWKLKKGTKKKKLKKGTKKEKLKKRN